MTHQYGVAELAIIKEIVQDICLAVCLVGVAWAVAWTLVRVHGQHGDQ